MKEKSGDMKLWLLIIAIIAGVILIAAVVCLICGTNPLAIFDGFSESGWWTAGAAVVAAAGLIGVIAASRAKWSVKKLMAGAMCVAFSFVLSLIVLFKMPQGGSVTPACMLPIIVFSYIYGWQYGICAGALLGILNLLSDPFIIHPIQLLLDYILGYAAIGVAGIWRKNICVSVVTASAARWFCSVLSGVIFFAEYAGEQNAWLYSMGYNGTFMGIEAVICIVIVIIPQVSSMINTLKKQYSERPENKRPA